MRRILSILRTEILDENDERSRPAIAGACLSLAIVLIFFRWLI